MKPLTTRLRWRSAKDKNLLVKFCDTLGARIEVKSIIFDGSEWVLWFVPDDLKSDIPSGAMQERKEKKK